MPDGKKRVLVIDDSAVQRSIYQTKLIAAGYEVHAAADGVQAMDEVKHFHPDLILLDMMLVEVSGMKILEQIRANPENAGIKVVVLSAKADLAGVQLARSAGADDYLVKSTSTPNSVVAKIAEVLGKP